MGSRKVVDCRRCRMRIKCTLENRRERIASMIRKSRHCKLLIRDCRRARGPAVFLVGQAMYRAFHHISIEEYLDVTRFFDLITPCIREYLYRTWYTKLKSDDQGGIF